MAGSYAHCTDEDGRFTFDLLDNMSDAFQACEEMHYMVRYLSKCNPQKIEKALEAFHAYKRRENAGKSLR